MDKLKGMFIITSSGQVVRIESYENVSDDSDEPDYIKVNVNMGNNYGGIPINEISQENKDLISNFIKNEKYT